MKTTALLSLIICFCLYRPLAFGQTGQLFPKKGANEKFGYVDKSGAVKIDFIYDKASEFSSAGYAEVYKGDNVGIIDVQGKEFYPIDYFKIDRSKDSEDILDAQGHSVLPFSLKGKNVEIDGFELYTNIVLYANRALIQVNDTEEGLYDCKLRKFIIPMAKQEIHGLGMAEEIGLPGGQPKTSPVPNISDFLLRIQRKKNTKDSTNIYALVNFDNRVLVPFGKFDDIDDYGPFDGLIEVEKSEKHGFIDCKGNEVITCRYEATGIPADGIISVQDPKTHLYGLVNYAGKKILDCLFKQIKESGNYFVNGLCAAQNTDDKWGFVNLSGVPVVPFQYKEVTPYLGNYAAAETDDLQWTIIDKNGKAIALKYTFYSGTLNHGYIDEEENVVTSDSNNGSLTFGKLQPGGTVENYGSFALPYLINFLHCKKSDYLQLLTFDTANKKQICLLVSANGKFEYRITEIK